MNKKIYIDFFKLKSVSLPYPRMYSQMKKIKVRNSHNEQTSTMSKMILTRIYNYDKLKITNAS